MENEESLRTINLPLTTKIKRQLASTFLEKKPGKDKKNFRDSIEFIKQKGLRPAYEDEDWIDFWKNQDCGKELIEVETIELPGNGILVSEFADKLVNKIKYTDDLFFREDMREVVEITNLGFNIVKPARFITIAEKYFKPWTTIFTKNGKMAVDRSMNQQTANVVLSSPNFQDKINSIKRIFPVPLAIEYSGELTFPKKGYDKRFESWLNYNTPNINPNISIEEAKETLHNIYKEFCFQERQDYINAIAGLITPFLRGLFSDFNVRTPMFCYMANRERAGKDYCAGVTGLVLEGYNLEEPPISSGEYKSSGTNDELRKKLVSGLIAGKKRMHFANNKGKLNNAVLEGFLTSKIFSDRLLGKNDSPNFSNEIDVSISGNMGMTFTADLANRSRFVRLFLDIEDANQRQFDNPNLHKWVQDNRSLIISSIYALIRNWYEKGKPKGSLPFASFPEWAEICGGIMECAGIGNPCVKDEKAGQGAAVDEDTEEMKLLFEIANEKYEDQWLKKDEIRRIIQTSEDPMFVYIDWNNMPDQVKFAKKLDKFVGRILSDIRLIVENPNTRASRRKYKFSKETANFNKNVENSSHNHEKSGKVVRGGKVLSQSKIPIYNKGKLEHGENPAISYHLTTCEKCGKETENEIKEIPICEECAKEIPEELK